MAHYTLKMFGQNSYSRNLQPNYSAIGNLGIVTSAKAVKLLVGVTELLTKSISFLHRTPLRPSV